MLFRLSRLSSADALLMSDMGNLLPFLVLVTFYLCCVAGRTPCTTPSGKRGECRFIYDCKTLLYTMLNATSSQSMTSSISFCRTDVSSNFVEVCCPRSDTCITPKGEQGTCVELHACPQLTENLMSSPTLATIKYTLRHICQEYKDKVCCTESFDSPPKNINETTCRMRTLPPEYTSGCCGYQNIPQIRIFGGSITRIDEYPWLALLEYEKNNSTYLECGGVLISGNHVLTAGHCINRRLPAYGEPNRVRLGEYDTTTSPDCVPTDGGGTQCADNITIVPIKKITVHPEFDTLSDLREHDIALIKLQWTVDYTDYIRPICLPTYDITLSQEDVNLYVAGWGFTERNSSSAIKMKVDLPYVPIRTCRSILGSNYSRLLDDGQICVGGELGKDSCSGDSGGPLMRDINGQHELVGIVSFGFIPCGKFNAPGIYTKVFHYLSWITHNIGELTFKDNLV